MTKEDPKLSKLDGWLKVIKGEVQELVMAKDMFQEVEALIIDDELSTDPALFLSVKPFAELYLRHKSRFHPGWVYQHLCNVYWLAKGNPDSLRHAGR